MSKNSQLQTYESLKLWLTTRKFKKKKPKSKPLYDYEFGLS